MTELGQRGGSSEGKARQAIARKCVSDEQMLCLRHPPCLDIRWRKNKLFLSDPGKPGSAPMSQTLLRITWCDTNRAIPINMAMQVAPPHGQLCNKCKWRHLVAKFGANASDTFWGSNLYATVVRFMT